MDCPVCEKKFKTTNNYLKHVEKKHSSCNQCGSGVRVKTPTLPIKNFSKKLDNVLDKTKKVEQNIKFNSLVYDFKVGKGLSVEDKSKIKSLVLENEYLKGQIDSQNKQIKNLQKQISKCIKSSITYKISK